MLDHDDRLGVDKAGVENYIQQITIELPPVGRIEERDVGAKLLAR